MPRKPGILNTRTHLEHLELIFEGLDKYGLCPLVEAEIAKAKMVNKAILARPSIRKPAARKKD